MTERVFITEQQIPDVLVGGYFHRVMLFFHRPTEWPRWLMATAVLLLAFVASGTWWLLYGAWQTALLAGGMQLVFFAADAAVLRSLPRRRISFGDWRAQFFPLALLRVLATAVAGLVGLLAGWQAALGLALFAQLMGTLLLSWASLVEPAGVTMTRLRITSDRLASGTPPMRIFHISDLHIDRLSVRETAVLEAIQRTQPDAIVITGDFVSTSNNTDRETFEQVRRFLSRLSAPYGVYATLGTPPVDLREFVVPLFEGLPVTLLREAWHKIDMGKGRELVLMGMDCTHDIPHDAASLQRMVEQAPQEAPQVLLYHSPELMPQAVEHGLDLYLCGHTHGGQVRLPAVGALMTSSQLGRRYVMGHYPEGRTHLYVSRGVGFEGLSAPRVRLLSPPEVTLVTIRPA